MTKIQNNLVDAKSQKNSQSKKAGSKDNIQKKYYQLLKKDHDGEYLGSISPRFDTFREAYQYYSENIKRDCDLKCDWCEDKCHIEYYISFHEFGADKLPYVIYDFFIERLDIVAVNSQHGEITINMNTGYVVENNNTKYKDIVRFDIAEYCEYWREELAGAYDILDLGYWDKEGKYEKPEEDFRKEVKTQETRKPCRQCLNDWAMWVEDDWEYGKGWFCTECHYSISPLPIINR